MLSARLNFCLGWPSGTVMADGLRPRTPTIQVRTSFHYKAQRDLDILVSPGC